MASLGTEIILSHSDSGQAFWFKADGDFDLGDFLAHDTLPVFLNSIESLTVRDEKVALYMKSGRVLLFYCYKPDEVPEGEFGVTNAFGLAVDGETAYLRSEAVLAAIYDKMNLDVPE